MVQVGPGDQDCEPAQGQGRCRPHRGHHRRDPGRGAAEPAKNAMQSARLASRGERRL